TILKKSNILNILLDYGEIKLVGSYPLHVMLRPDLDMYVLAKKHDYEKCVKIVSSIFSMHYFQQICFANWLDYPRKSGNTGYYLEPRVTIGDNRWKLDIWLMTYNQYEP